MVDRIADTADKTLSDHRPHRSAHETEFKCGGDHRVMLQLTSHHDQRVSFRGFRAGFGDTLRVGLRVNKLERVFREDFGSDFLFRAIVVEERLKTRAGTHSHVIAALRALDIEEITVGKRLRFFRILSGVHRLPERERNFFPAFRALEGDVFRKRHFSSFGSFLGSVGFSLGQSVNTSFLFRGMPRAAPEQSDPK